MARLQDEKQIVPDREDSLEQEVKLCEDVLNAPALEKMDEETPLDGEYNSEQETPNKFQFVSHFEGKKQIVTGNTIDELMTDIALQ